MNLEESVVEGTLKADGTLELDDKPNLRPGRVTVVLRQHGATSSSAEDWWQFMQRTRQELEAAGSPFMNEKEIAAHVDWLREDDRIDELLRQDSPPAPQERL